MARSEACTNAELEKLIAEIEADRQRAKENFLQLSHDEQAVLSQIQYYGGGGDEDIALIGSTSAYDVMLSLQRKDYVIEEDEYWRLNPRKVMETTRKYLLI